MTRSAAFPSFVAAAMLVAGAARADLAEQLRAVADESTVELTTTGRTSGQPRTVTIWFVVDGDRVFVQSGQEGKTDWYRNVLKTPAVSLRLGTLSLRGRAQPVDDAAETARVHALFEQKYLSARLLGLVGSSIGHGRVVRIDAIETVTSDQ